jgi:hypothetical protein
MLFIENKPCSKYIIKLMTAIIIIIIIIIMVIIIVCYVLISAHGQIHPAL